MCTHNSMESYILEKRECDIEDGFHISMRVSKIRTFPIYISESIFFNGKTELGHTRKP